MRVLRIVTVILFVITLCVFLLLTAYEKRHADNTVPKIILPQEPLEVSIASAPSALLSQVYAYDEKDGEITDQVLIESISQLISDGMCTVTYAVADSDRHVTKATRALRYTDYISPRFGLKRPLVFAVGEKIEFRNILLATDCIDGDISGRITILASDYISTLAGVYTISIQVTNSLGDMVHLDLPVYVEQYNRLAPTIALTEPLIYLKAGEKLDVMSYVSGVTVQGQPARNYQLEYSTDLDSTRPGMYSVHYYAADALGHEGHTVLTVIVEE